MVVSRGYFAHASSHSENVASARKVAKNSHLYGNSTYISIIDHCEYMHALTSCCFFNLLTDILICAMYIAKATSVLIFTFMTSLILNKLLQY